MGDILWAVLAILWLLYFVHHIVEWRKGNRSFWQQNDFEKNQVIPKIYGVGAPFDKFVRAEKARKRRNY